MAHLDLSVNSLNSSIKSGYKSTNSPSTNQAMLSGNWRQTSHFKQNKNLEQARLSYCNDLGPRLVCQHDTQGPVCCVRVWTVNHIWKGKVGMLKVWTWRKSTLILACRACFGKKLSIHRQLPEFSSCSSQLSPQPVYSFSWCLPSTKPFHGGAYLELGGRTWDCYEGFVTQGFRAQLHNLNSDEYVGIDRFAPMNNNSLSEQGVREFGPYFPFCWESRKANCFFSWPPHPHFIVKEICSPHMCNNVW